MPMRPVAPPSRPESGGLTTPADSHIPSELEALIDAAAAQDLKLHGAMPKSVKAIKATVAAKSRERDNEIS